MKNDKKNVNTTSDQVMNRLFVGSVKKPRDLIFEENDNEIKLVMNGTKVMNDNMQTPANAFEGWAVATRACMLDLNIDHKVVLDVSPRIHYDYENTKGQGHLARFLYRAIRFNEQYAWFELSDALAQETSKFKKFLEAGTFYNNIPNGEAGNTERVEDENTIEEALSKGNVLKNILTSTVDVGDNKVYRQLPVGLFKTGVSEENAIFTGKKSAIDLWTYNGTEISVIELKFKNKMIGIVSEIFFYSNYVYDLVSGNEWFIINNSQTEARGYEKLTVAGLYESINGIMLADKEKGFHLLLNGAALKVLNESNNEHIRYYMADYEYKCEVWHG